MKPTAKEIELLSGIPAELRQPAQWLQYYPSPDPKHPDKKPRKHPTVKYRTKEDRKANLRSLDYLLTERANINHAGFQRYIDKEEGFTYIDLDHCRNAETGELEPWARAIVDEIDSYTEISASCMGLHIVCRGTLPKDFQVAGNPTEIYAGNSTKLIALTGNILDFNARIEARQEQVEAVLAQCKTEAGFVKANEAKPATQFEENLVIRCIDDVQALPIEWLWPNRIPLSAISAFTGNPDTGKTLGYCDLIARVTMGRDYTDAPMPEGVGGEVLMLCSEDDYARVVKPRLMAAGADTKAVFYIEKVEMRQGAKRDERMFALDSDLSKLEAKLEANPLYALVVIDPISSYFGKGSMNDKQDVRTVFNRLKDISEKYRIAIVVVEHFNKRVDVSAIHKMGGSVALTAATRAVFMFAKVPDEEGQHAMHFVKGNFAKRKVGLRFTIAEKQVGDLGGVPYIVWGAEDACTADDLLMAEKGVSETSRAARATKFLKEFLTEEKLADEVLAEAKKRNISRNALYEVKKDLGIRAGKRGGQWYWKPAVESSKEPETYDNAA